MLRILPVTLVAVLMVLPLKLGTLLEGLPAIAQQFDREFGNHDRPWADDLLAPEDEDTGTPAAGSETASVMPAPADVRNAAPLAACENPMLLAAVAEQKDELTMRGRRLADAEAVLAATEARVGAQVSRLSEIKSEIESLMTQRSALQQEDIRRMVAIYEAMKPKDAARIFNDLETGIVVDVLDRMPERRSAPILAELVDEKAREVTRTILQRRNLPGDRPAAASSYPRAARAGSPLEPIPYP